MPNQNNSSTDGQSPIPIISPQSDLPPLPPTFQEVKTVTKTVAEPSPFSTGSAAPMPNTPPIISSGGHKKKFGGGRIIATLLGILLLVGGIGAGLILTQQQQLFQQKAAGGGGGAGCAAGYYACSKGCCAVQTPKPGGQSNCTGGASRSCTVNGCQGVQICNGTDWNACVKSDPACGTSPGGGSPGGSQGGSCTGALPGGCNTGLTCVNNVCQPIGTPKPCAAGLIQCNGVCVQGTSCSNVGAGGTCSSTGQCVNGYVCDSTTFKCVANTNTTSCGRNVDTGAPVCCTGDCPVADRVCEKPNRLECKTGTTHCTIDVNGCTSGASNPPGEQTASCQAVKAYSSNWSALTTTQLSALSPGTSVNFCVTGTTTGGGFDKAKFTINNVAGAEITTKGQGAAANAFCTAATIAAGATTVRAQIHHSSLGWSN